MPKTNPNFKKENYKSVMHKAKLLSRDEVEAKRSNAYDYLDLNKILT